MSTLSIAPVFTPERERSVRPTQRPTTQPAAPAAPRSTVRLTRRGRLVVFFAALSVVLMAGFFLGAGSVATGEAGTPAPTTTVMVEPGDTLWGIAAEASDGGDVRETMREIERLNALESVALNAGQKLRVPAAD
jgi:Tfp pilus assembly protein FimV